MDKILSMNSCQSLTALNFDNRAIKLRGGTINKTLLECMQYV